VIRSPSADRMWVNGFERIIFPKATPRLHKEIFRGKGVSRDNVLRTPKTHGVGHPFVQSPQSGAELSTMRNGKLANSHTHLPTGDYISVTEIAQLAIEALQLDGDRVDLRYTGGDRGWKGDVPVVRLNTDRIQSLGWRCRYSTREALRLSMQALVAGQLVARAAI
jgi:hypothetical protein